MMCVGFWILILMIGAIFNHLVGVLSLVFLCPKIAALVCDPMAS